MCVFSNKRFVFQHEWKHENQKAMTREDFMDVLFLVDYVLIKASHGSAMRHSRSGDAEHSLS